MAVGVRITSNNLSGKTATVDFVPVTGYTSGTTQNLGSKVVPFNNITSYPYGDYSLYFAEYDYSYPVTVEPDYGVNQSSIHTSTLPSGSTSASYYYNFGDFTGTTVDYNINTSDWILWDQYPLNEKGYMHIYYGQGNFSFSEKLVLFTDFAGNILEQYSGTSSNFDYDILDGIYCYASFTDLGILKYTDGLSGFTFTWSPGTNSGEFDNFEIEWDWDGATLTNQFVVNISNSITTDEEFYLIDRGTHTLLDTNNYTTTHKMFIRETRGTVHYSFERSESTYIYDNLKIYNSDGSVIRTFTFTEQYDNFNYSLFGDNQFGVVFWNENNDAIDYYIIRYNGNTNQYATTTHVRGANYRNVNASYDSWIYGHNYEPSSWVLKLFSDTLDYSQVTGYSMGYVDFIYTLDDNETLYTATYQNSGTNDKSINIYYITESKLPLTYGNTGDGNVSTIQFTPTGLSYNIIGTYTNFYTDWLNLYAFGDRYVFSIRDANDQNSGTLFLISSGNTFLDTQSYLLGNPWLYNERISYDIFYFSDYTSDGWYVNKNLNQFLSIGNYISSHGAIYFNKQFLGNHFLVYNNNNNLTPTVRVLTKTLLYDEITLPTNNGTYTIRIGKTRFLYVYGNPTTNIIKIELYDFDGNLKNSLVTPYTSYDVAYVSKDRYVVKSDDSGNYILYNISDNYIHTATMSTDSNYSGLNDIIWWWD